MNIFDIRTFNPDEIDRIKNIVEEGVNTKGKIKDLQESLNDTVKMICQDLNDGIKNKEQKVKPSMIKKMINIKFKDSLEEEKDKLKEVETILDLVK